MRARGSAPPPDESALQRRVEIERACGPAVRRELTDRFETVENLENEIRQGTVRVNPDGSSSVSFWDHGVVRWAVYHRFDENGDLLVPRLPLTEARFTDGRLAPNLETLAAAAQFIHCPEPGDKFRSYSLSRSPSCVECTAPALPFPAERGRRRGVIPLDTEFEACARSTFLGTSTGTATQNGESVCAFVAHWEPKLFLQEVIRLLG